MRKLGNFAIFSFILLIGMNLTSCRSSNPDDSFYYNDQDQDTFEQALPLAAGEREDLEDNTISSETFPAHEVYYFDFDKNILKNKTKIALKKQAYYLLNHLKAHIRLEGHTDQIGSREYNVALGLRRVQAVKSFLEMRGVSSQQIALVSYGKEKLISFEFDEASRQLNRRVELYYEARD